MQFSNSSIRGFLLIKRQSLILFRVEIVICKVNFQFKLEYSLSIVDSDFDHNRYHLI